jgi:hypothetical protein
MVEKSIPSISSSMHSASMINEAFFNANRYTYSVDYKKLWLSIMETLNLCIQNFGVYIITLLYAKLHKITKETLFQQTKYFILS